MTGRALTTSVTALARRDWDHTPRAAALPGAERKGGLDPAVEMITKPFTFEALAARNEEVMDTIGPTSRILIVEDEVLIQMLLIDHLEDLGFSVEVAGSAAAARAALQQSAGEIAGAILDVGLPDTKGDVLAVELRGLYPALPLIIASGHDGSGLRDRLESHAPIAFLGKPFAAADLHAALRAAGAAV